MEMTTIPDGAHRMPPYTPEDMRQISYIRRFLWVLAAVGAVLTVFGLAQWLRQDTIRNRAAANMQAVPVTPERMPAGTYEIVAVAGTPLLVQHHTGTGAMRVCVILPDPPRVECH